ncbi:zinc finger protein 723-like isoform X9 [Dermacentor albipictus]
MPLTAEAPTTHLWSSPLVPIMPGPERATLTSRNYPPLRETPREILRPRGFTKATQSTTRLQAHPPSRGMHTTEIPEALVSHFQSAAAAAVANTQWPVQATWARRKHRTFWEMMLEFLTSPALSHGVRSTTWLVAQLQSPAGHTHVTESGRASSPFMASSSSVNPAQTSTSRAGMEEASAVPENIARNAPGTGGTEQRELCGVCGNVSSRLDALHGHAREPTDDIAQICKACGQSSVKMSKFVEHCRDLTGKKQKCETCGKQFHRAHHLAQHHCTDTDEKLYKCKMCDKSFRHSHHLKIHKRTHTDERPHKCQICAKSFRQSSHLDKHKRTHTDERPYKCQICNKWFRTSSHLDTHKRQHTGEKPYICKTCGKSYARAESLHGHEHAHAEEKPHACQKCGKSFSRKYNLKRHADSHC